MQNNVCAFQIINFCQWTFLYCPPYTYRPSIFDISKDVALCFTFVLVLFLDFNLFLKAFLCCYNCAVIALPFMYCNSNSCHSFSLLKVKFTAKCKKKPLLLDLRAKKATTIHIFDGWKGYIFRESDQEKKQRAITL